MIAALFCACMAGCETADSMSDISQVIFTSGAGTILPELQWGEQIIIARDKVSLTRSGATGDTQVNAGSWEIVVEAQKVTALFEQLKAVDCSIIRRVEPDDPPDGGGSQSYTVVYANGEKCTLLYDPGTTYANGDLIARPVDEFIESLELPAAANRYK